VSLVEATWDHPEASQAVPSPVGLVLRLREREKVTRLCGTDEGRWEETSPAEKVRMRVFPIQQFNQSTNYGPIIFPKLPEGALRRRRKLSLKRP
jgi:hypothetical protein